MRWIRRHPLIIAYVLAIAAFTAAVAGMQREGDQRRAEDKRQTEQTTADLCETVNDQQAVLSDLLDVVLSGDSGLHLSQIPSFQQLDAATQRFFLDLEALSAQDNPNSLDERLRAFAADRLVPAECKP